MRRSKTKRGCRGRHSIRSGYTTDSSSITTRRWRPGVGLRRAWLTALSFAGGKKWRSAISWFFTLMASLATWITKAPIISSEWGLVSLQLSENCLNSFKWFWYYPIHTRDPKSFQHTLKKLRVVLLMPFTISAESSLRTPNFWTCIKYTKILS